MFAPLWFLLALVGIAVAVFVAVKWGVLIIVIAVVIAIVEWVYGQLGRGPRR